MDLTRFIRSKKGSEKKERRLNIVFASSEVAPFSKTGGLGDVSASLPKAMGQRGHNVVVITPLYGHLDPETMRLSRRLETLDVPRKAKNQNKVKATLWETRLDHGVRVIFIDAPEFFRRDGGLYGVGEGDYGDNPERFAFFSRSVTEFVRHFSLDVDILHCNDWHTALAPIYARHYYEDEFKDTKIVMTIHNLAFQGKFEAARFDATGLPKKYASDAEIFDDDGDLNYLKGGLLYADLITTVSRGYADEIRTEAGGCGLHQVLTERSNVLSGILNGADYSVWSPDIDRHISVQYTVETLNGKRQNKAELQHRFGLPIRPTLPILAMISRLSEQKGVDLLARAVTTLLTDLNDERDGFQLVIFGEGPAQYRDELDALQQAFPRRVVFQHGYDEAQAHRIQAGADMLLVPSKYEPCGLTQIYAMHYGTVPVVHATGGLRDTVIDLRESPDEGTGFTFVEHTPEALAGAIERATVAYKNYRRWRPLMVRAMQKDFSWAASAQQYEDLFRSAITHRAADAAE